ncbi:hypothetical protein [Lentilactobacillus parabuchneri]|uniref:hypothetical protein n=1 Tax=Lentilactobacillus parabuchneri TaxID=152331 RepID=UPI0022358FBB|nr:hypothetical protein [Lentilactobacillus parabuchneri]
MEDVKFDVITEAIKSLDTSHFIFDWTSPFPNEVVIGAFIKAELVAVIGFIPSIVKSSATLRIYS